MVRKAGIAFLSFLLFCSLSVFGATFAMNRTILNPEFAIAQVDRVDMSALVEEALKERLPFGEIEFVREAMDDIIADLEPWMSQQMHTAIYISYDYLLGRSESLRIVVDLRPAKETLRESLWQALLASPPPEVAGLSQAELELLFAQFYDEVAGQIPATFEINETTINKVAPEIMGMKALDFAKWLVSRVQLAYRISIGAMIGIIVGLIFLNRRQVKGATRSIGIPCLICGIGFLVSSIVGKGMALSFIAAEAIPAQLQAWLLQFVSDLLAPAQMYGIGLMATGIALLIVSVVYKRGQVEPF